MRLLAARHAGETAGLVLIEPAIPEEWVEPTGDQRVLIARGARLCGYGAAAARHGLARVVSVLVSLGALGLARALVKIVSRGGLRREDEGILAPVQTLPPDARQVLRRMWTQPKFFEALGSQIENVCASADEVLRETSGTYGDLPLVVMSSATATERRLRADLALAGRSTRGRHVLAPDSGHWIPLDAPQAIVDAIVTLVQDIRGDKA